MQMAVEERAPAKQDQGLFSSIFSLLNSDTTGEQGVDKRAGVGHIDQNLVF